MALKQSSTSAVLGNNSDTPWFAKDAAAIEVPKLRASIHRALDVLAVRAFFAVLPRMMAHMSRRANSHSVPIRAFVVATWLLFAIAILLLDAPNPGGIYYLINAIGLTGLGVSITWLAVAPKWRLACATVSVILVSTYLLRWYLQVDDIYRISPTLGVSTAFGRLIQVWTSVFEANHAKYGLLWAALAAYWDVLIVPIQVLVVALLLSYRRGGDEHVVQANS